MMEPAVTLTNFILVAECWAFALALGRADDPARLLRWFALLFAALGLGALLGGLTHGFVPETRVLANRLVWSGNMLSLGLAGATIGVIAARIALSAKNQTRIGRAILVLLLAYAALVIFVTQDFLLALAAAVPPVLLLILALLGLMRRAPRPGLGLVVLGLGLNLLAGVQQQLQIAIHPVWFNHNALFHVIEMLAFWLIYRGSRAVAAAVQAQAGSRA